MAETTFGSTTLDSDLYPCGAANRTAIIDQEDRGNFRALIAAFSCCAGALWVIFAAWHGATQCAYWHKLKSRHLFEPRVMCCRPCPHKGRGGDVSVRAASSCAVLSSGAS